MESHCTNDTRQICKTLKLRAFSKLSLPHPEKRAVSHISCRNDVGQILASGRLHPELPYDCQGYPRDTQSKSSPGWLAREKHIGDILKCQNNRRLSAKFGGCCRDTSIRLREPSNRSQSLVVKNIFIPSFCCSNFFFKLRNVWSQALQQLLSQTSRLHTYIIHNNATCATWSALWCISTSQLPFCIRLSFHPNLAHGTGANGSGTCVELCLPGQKCLYGTCVAEEAVPSPAPAPAPASRRMLLKE